jgi:uncharacterized protein
MRVLISFLIGLMAFTFAAGAVDFPSPTGFINDYANVLSAAEKQELTSISEALKQSTGMELAVAVVKTVAPLDSKTYAVELFEKWKIGRKGKDDGVLVLLAMEERRIEIEVGYGLEGVLTDAVAGRILDAYAVPYFKQGQFGKGLVETARAISRKVGGVPDEKLVAEEKKGNNQVGDEFLIYVLIAVIILGVIFRRGSGIVAGIFGVIWGVGMAGLAGAIMGGILGLMFGSWGLMTMGRGGGFGGGGGGFGGFGGGSSGGGGSGRSF